MANQCKDSLEYKADLLRDGRRFRVLYSLMFAAIAGDKIAHNILVQTQLMVQGGNSPKNLDQLRKRVDAAMELVDAMELPL